MKGANAPFLPCPTRNGSGRPLGRPAEPWGGFSSADETHFLPREEAAAQGRWRIGERQQRPTRLGAAGLPRSGEGGPEKRCSSPHSPRRRSGHSPRSALTPPLPAQPPAQPGPPRPPGVAGARASPRPLLRPEPAGLAQCERAEASARSGDAQPSPARLGLPLPRTPPRPASADALGTASGRPGGSRARPAAALRWRRRGAAARRKLLLLRRRRGEQPCWSGE